MARARPDGLLFARLASNIGLEHLVGPGAGRRVHLPDGSDRFIVDERMLLDWTARLGGRLVDPIKTTNVQQLRYLLRGDPGSSANPGLRSGWTSAISISICPPELIAQAPPAGSVQAARLLCLDRASGALTHTRVSELPALLRAGDLVVVNNTRVFPARLIGRRVPSGGAVECLLVGRAEAEGGLSGAAPLVHPGQKLKPRARFVCEGAHIVHGEILERGSFGRRLVRLWTEDGSTVDEAVDAIGHVPLPPYIKRDDEHADRERYQTVFAHARGSVAAPTAGLHFTPDLIAALKARGVQLAEITLHVGYGTFQPIRVDRVEDHRLESERYEIDADTAAAIQSARDERRRVIAVGTTTTRTLEAVAGTHDGRVVAGTGATDLFIYPGFEFRVVDGLLTNFHVPRSSLLDARLGVRRSVSESWRTAYDAATPERYRFYSYGDAMLIL